MAYKDIGRQTGYFRTGWKRRKAMAMKKIAADGRPDTSERDGNL